jgi:hypothetical protein
MEEKLVSMARSVDDVLKPFSRVTNVIDLPSDGLPYNGNLPEGRLVVTPMTAQEEAMLAGSSGDAAGVIESLLGRCVVDCPIKLDDLISQDRFFIVLMLRVNSYGSVYQFKTKCDRCGLSFIHTIDILKDLKIKNLDPETFCEPYPCHLPAIGSDITLRYLRGTDESAVTKYVRQYYLKNGKQQQEISKEDPGYIYRLAKQIVTVDGVDVTAPSNFSKILTWLKSLIGTDISAIRKANEEHDCGFDTTMEIKCLDASCGHVTDRTLPFTAEFFRSAD